MNKLTTPAYLLIFFCILFFSNNVLSEELQPQPSATPSGADPAQTTAPKVSATTADSPAPAAPPAEKDKRIIRAVLTNGIADREPTDEIVSINRNQDRIYYFTEFADMNGQVVKHRWEYQGKVMAEVNFNVGGSPWRCYSSKNIQPEWTGIWTVSVLDESGKVINENLFEVTE